MKILGVDPSLRSTGYGLIEAHVNEMRAIEYGEIKNRAETLPSGCLVQIGDTMARVLENRQPDALAIEGLVYVQNTRIAFTLGQVRGVIIAVAAKRGVPVYEYAPRKVKQCVTGLGGAGKQQVAQMVKAMLGLNEIPPQDAGDALALAICHAQSLQGIQLNPPRQI